MRLLTPEEGERALEQVDRARARARSERGSGWCYAADELFLLAGRSVPAAEYYDDGSLLENGVGALRRFLDDFDAGLTTIPKLTGRRIRLATGTSMASFLRERSARLAEATGAEVDVVEVSNTFFGETVTIAGLLGGEDLLRSLEDGRAEDDIVLLPAEALNADERFIDDMPLEHLKERLAPSRVVPGHEVTASLGEL